MRPESSLFTFWEPVEVRFKDIDLGGHAHHSMALVYFEEARAGYWRDVVGRGDEDEVDFILAEARVRYHRRVLYPQRLKVGVRVSFLGRKHFIMEYLALGADGGELVSGETTMVMFDYAEGKTKRLPPEVRAAVESYEISAESHETPVGPQGQEE
ncbi:MAG: acyl-CoA thioesterase [Gemmatimonadetes bacterium]|nr:acyl-CoA thioesterase [Gemmatimonadota bacterium]NNM04535.1 acyl-CoA thioesterase [Gemmatimonadota bacterium]